MIDLGRIIEPVVQTSPDKIAVEHLAQTATYAELHLRANETAEKLLQVGIKRGDRIGIYARKSIEIIASILAILKAEACYVPVGVDSPASRNLFIFQDCDVKLIIIEEEFLPSLAAIGAEITILGRLAANLCLASLRTDKHYQTEHDGLAYILYTSGSTGTPKGVMYSYVGAGAFIDWCTATFPFHQAERFSSHAPFHFDLSIFDLYVCFRNEGTLVLIDEETGKNPMELAKLISEKKISVWYSTPSVLSLLTQFGKLDRYDFSSLKLVFFAGEVFPVKHLRSLASIWKSARFFNLYGPTETNVCTYFEVPVPISEDRVQPFPIGKSCTHVTCKAFDENGNEIRTGQRGELHVTGKIMSGYWNLPERTAHAYHVDSYGTQWYKTGDIVEIDSDGNFVYVGRQDRMVKRRGYRVEMGEIEAALSRHPAVIAVAVVSIPVSEGGIQLKAFLQMSDNQYASTLKMKQYASEVLPPYMIPDRFSFLSSLPKTTTDKIDYQSLLNL